MAPTVESEQNLTTLKEKLEILANGDRKSRRNAVDDISKHFETASQSENTDLVMQFSEISFAALITCFQNEQQEYCREKSAEIVWELIKYSSNYEKMAVYFVPAATQRLNTTNGGLFIEPSEEVRLVLVKGLNCLTKRLNGEMDSGHFDDISSALSRTLLDPYPELKKESCDCIRSLALSVRKQLHRVSQSLIAPLLQNLVHQHSKVRLAAIDAIGCVVQYSSSECLKDVYPQIARRLFDQVPQVRKAVAIVVGTWLTSLPDRHSCYGHLVPLLLTCISDEVSEISELATKLWIDAGALYLEENKKVLQDRIDYDSDVVGRLPNNAGRPSLGCRTLVTSNLSYVLPAVVNDLRDWKDDARIKAAQLLLQLLLHSEDRMVSQLQKIVDSLVVGCSDEEPKVVEKMVACAQIVGHFISADIWWNLIEDKLNGVQSTAAPLMVLSALIRGSCVKSLLQRLKHITSFLSQPGVCHVSEIAHRKQVLSCVVSICDMAGDDCRFVAYDLFFVLLSLLALSGEDNDGVNNAISQLCCIMPTENLAFLCVQYANDVFAYLSGCNNAFWSSQSADWLIFNLLVCELGTANLVDFLDKLLLFFGAALTSESEYEMKFRCLQTVSYLATTAKPLSAKCSQLDNFFVVIMKDAVFPCLFWRGGRSEATIRAAALTSVWSILNHCSISPETLATIFSDLVRNLINLVEDDNKTTRFLVCRILHLCFRDYSMLFEADQYFKLSSDLLKRVDDSAEDVRLAAVECLGQCLSSWSTSDLYSDELHCKHLEYICLGMVVFLDDSDANLRTGTLRALKEFAKHRTRQLKTVLDRVKSGHRNRETYDELVEHVANLALC